MEAFAESDFLRVEVKDHGRGIPPEAIPFIFEKFYRAPRPPLPSLQSIPGPFLEPFPEDDTPGAGLGLAFVRDIAQLHGGHVTVESEVGAGSVFTLRLPFLQKQFEDKHVETARLNR
jgi:signal transduction histidine kinase